MPELGIIKGTCTAFYLNVHKVSWEVSFSAGIDFSTLFLRIFVLYGWPESRQFFSSF